MESNKIISFLDMELIKLDNDTIVINWHRKSTYSDSSHESFPSANLYLVRKILFLKHSLANRMNEYQFN